MRTRGRRRPRPAGARLAAAVSAAVLGGCACGIDLAPEELTEVLRRWPGVRQPQRTQATIQLRSAPFTGEFQAILIQRPRPLAIRMQLFPDLGGKTLDLAATATTQNGILPMTGATLAYPGGAEDRFLAMFAATALEITAPLDRDRVVCCRRLASGHGFRLELTPRFGTSSCVVELRGTTRRYHLRRRGVGWTATITAAGALEVAGRGFALTTVVDESEALDEVPDEVFAPPR